MPDKKILVADDDAGIVEAMQFLLEDGGYKVLTTMDGTQVSTMYRQKPDLVFLDIYMSGINGNTVCKELKSDEETKHVPIIMFSANSDTQQIAEQCGADDYLPKPFEIKELFAIVHKHLG